MKKARKGFTLVELLVVIAIMGILGGMAMLGGQEATNAAKAAKIVEGLQNGAAALQTFYIDIHESIDKTPSNQVATDAATIATGASAYLKDALEDGSNSITTTEGKYNASVGTGNGPSQTWWIGYKFKAGDGDKVKAIVANKKDLGLKASVGDAATAYTDEATVYMKAR